MDAVNKKQETSTTDKAGVSFNLLLSAAAVNHKWEHIEGKNYKCVRCNIHKRWEYGDYQCWYYYEPAYGYGAVEKGSFKRPQCSSCR